LTNEKNLADAFFCPPSLEGVGPLAVEDFFILYAFGDPLLSASNKSGQKCLSAHFAISNNVSLRSPLVKFEAEPNPCGCFNAIWRMKKFWLVPFLLNYYLLSLSSICLTKQNHGRNYRKIKINIEKI
jgi:hypothetical protein